MLLDACSARRSATSGLDWDASEGDCESACEGMPGTRVVTTESGMSRLGEGEGEGEGMSVAVPPAALIVDDLDTRVVRLLNGSAICFRLAFLGLGLPFVSYRHIRGTHVHAHGEETKHIRTK